MQLTDILPLEQWETLERELAQKFNLQSSVFNAEGIRITSNKCWSNRLCPEIKALDKGQAFICAVAHMNMSNQARQDKSPVIEECDAGLLKLVVPIIFNDEYLGVIGGCGLLAEDGEVDVFAVNKITDMDTEKIEALSTDVPTMTRKEAESACEFILTRLNTVLSHVKHPLN